MGGSRQTRCGHRRFRFAGWRFAAVVLVIVEWFVLAGTVEAQRIGRRVLEYDRPDTTDEKTRALQKEHEHEEQALNANVQSARRAPFVSAQGIVKSETVVERSRLFGAGEPTMRAMRRPTRGELVAASTVPERDYPGRASEQAVAAAAFSHLLGYRERGFAQDAGVEFLAMGDRLDDPAPSLTERVSGEFNDGETERLIIPVSHAMDIPDDGFRDRNSGARGPVYRVNQIDISDDGKAEVIAAFSERNGHFFTKILGLEQDPRAGWRVVSEKDY